MNVIRVYNPNTTASFMRLFMPILEDQIGKIVDKITRQENEYVRLIRDTKQRKFDVILAKELSRLARNGKLSYEIRDIALIKHH